MAFHSVARLCRRSFKLRRRAAPCCVTCAGCSAQTMTTAQTNKRRCGACGSCAWRPLHGQRPLHGFREPNLFVRIREQDLEMLTSWHTAVMAAPREHVKLAPGEALVFDNYRMLHGRTAFGDGAENRQLWRQWVWTTDAKNVPVHNGQVGAVTSTPWTKDLNDKEGHAPVPVAVAAQPSKL